MFLRFFVSPSPSPDTLSIGRGTMGDGVLMEARFLVTVGGRRTGPATVQLVQGFILVQQCG